MISADVPQLILPDDYQGVLHDVKVFVKYGPDDSVYDNNKDIRDRVNRFTLIRPFSWPVSLLIGSSLAKILNVKFDFSLIYQFKHVFGC